MSLFLNSNIGHLQPCLNQKIKHRKHGSSPIAKPTGTPIISIINNDMNKAAIATFITPFLQLMSLY